MLATAADVLELTGYTADSAEVRRAQAIVEVYAGRPESLIDRPEDRAWMRYAVCWQVAYMHDEPHTVFEQANVLRVRQNDTTIDFGEKVYAVAPLVVKAVGHVSWNRSRIIQAPTLIATPVVHEEWALD